jgi:hypothetical protein
MVEFCHGLAGSTMTASTGVRLGYSPRPPWHRRRKVRRVTFCLIVVGAMAGVIMQGPRVWRRARILYYQYECSTFSQPPDTVVYEPDPARAALLLHKGLQYWGSESTPQYAIAPDPPCLVRLNSLVPVSCMSGLGFMHELRNHKGDRRLVVIDPPYDPSAFFYRVVPLTRPFGDSPATTNSVNIGSCYPGKLLLNLGSTTPDPGLRTFAGQVDPNDPSHFTFAYESPKGKGTIDGWLTDQCDIEMRVRDGPATTPPPDALSRMWSVPLGSPPSDIIGILRPHNQDLIDDRPR